MTISQEPDQRWSIDFVSDALNHGCHFRVRAVVDDHTLKRIRYIGVTLRTRTPKEVRSV